MADQAEAAFAKSVTTTLSSQPLAFGNDYQQPPENSLKRVPILPIDVPPPPQRHEEADVPAASISITFKSTKPVQSYTLQVQPTDTVSQIKSQLAAVAGAPPADVQRLLLKGKALADGKLLKEYAVKDGDTVNLMVKPGVEWDPTKVAPPTKVADPAAPEKSGETTLLPSNPSTRGHGRIPSVVLSPSPSLTASPGEKLIDIPLVLDTSQIPASPSAGLPDTPYRATLTQPAFWERLHGFLSTEFPHPGDAGTAWEDFFCASKGHLSVSEIAKIRDAVGVIGMAGT